MAVMGKPGHVVTLAMGSLTPWFGLSEDPAGKLRAINLFPFCPPPRADRGNKPNLTGTI